MEIMTAIMLSILGMVSATIAGNFLALNLEDFSAALSGSIDRALNDFLRHFLLCIASILTAGMCYQSAVRLYPTYIELVGICTFIGFICFFSAYVITLVRKCKKHKD